MPPLEEPPWPLLPAPLEEPTPSDDDCAAAEEETTALLEDCCAAEDDPTPDEDDDATMLEDTVVVEDAPALEDTSALEPPPEDGAREDDDARLEEPTTPEDPPLETSPPDPLEVELLTLTHRPSSLQMYPARQSPALEHRSLLSSVQPAATSTPTQIPAKRRMKLLQERKPWTEFAGGRPLG